MSCPLYEDYTRGCINVFPDVVTFSNFDVCESKAYQKCPIYHVINSKFRCQYFHTCLQAYIKTIPTFIEKLFAIKLFSTMAEYVSLSKSKYIAAPQEYKPPAETELFVIIFELIIVFAPLQTIPPANP